MVAEGGDACGRVVVVVTRDATALCGLGRSSSNSGHIDHPIVVQVVGAARAAVTLATCTAVENLFMIPLGPAMAEGGGAIAVAPGTASWANRCCS